MRKNLDTLWIKTKTKAVKSMEGKDAGLSGIVVTVLLCAIAVPCSLFFKTESTKLLSKVFDATSTGAMDLLKGITG